MNTFQLKMAESQTKSYVSRYKRVQANQISKLMTQNPSQKSFVTSGSYRKNLDSINEKLPIHNRDESMNNSLDAAPEIGSTELKE